MCALRMCKTFDDKSKKYKRYVIKCDKIMYGRIGTHTSRRFTREHEKSLHIVYVKSLRSLARSRTPIRLQNWPGNNNLPNYCHLSETRNRVGTFHVPARTRLHTTPLWFCFPKTHGSGENVCVAARVRIVIIITIIIIIIIITSVRVRIIFVIVQRCVPRTPYHNRLPRVPAIGRASKRCAVKSTKYDGCAPWDGVGTGRAEVT